MKKKLQNILNKIKQNNIFIKILYLLLGFTFFPSFVSSILFIFKISINWFSLPISCILLIITYFILFYKKSKNKKYFYIPLLVSFILIVISIVLSCYLKENTWDGWAYHLPSVINLSEGWNPVYNHDENIGIWSLHYPKFIWIYGGVLYNITGNMFAGTSFNLLLIFSIFFLSLDILLKKKINTILSIVISFCISFNITAIGQLFSYYNDGVLGNCIWGLLLIFYALSKKIYNIKNNYLIILLISFFASILANIKFNGALYALIIVFAILSYLYIKKEIKFNKFLLFSCIIIGLSVFSVAITTYLPNLIYHHNIGYPIIGENKIDIIEWFLPNMFKNSGKISSFITAIFTNPRVDDFSFYPFYKFDIDIIKSVISAESGRSGFGGIYQLIVIISIFLLMTKLLMSLTKKRKKLNISEIRKILKVHTPELLISFIILIIFYITPATWWFRYLPYMYVLPLIMLVFYKKDWSFKGIYNKLCLSLIGIYLVYAIILSGGKLLSQYNYMNKFNNSINEFKELSNNNNLEISVYDKDDNYYKEEVRRQLFEDYNIKYKEYENSECKIINEHYIFGINTLDCKMENDGE